MESIGSRLKNAREKKSLTLEKVNKDTKVHYKILQALEEDRLDKTMNPVYARSFLKTYARYLGMDSKQITDEYSALHPADVQPNINIEKVTATASAARQVQSDSAARQVQSEQKAGRPLKDRLKALYPVLTLAGIIILAVAAVFLSVAAVKYARSHIKIRKTEIVKKDTKKSQKKTKAAKEPAQAKSAPAVKPVSIPKNQALVLTVRAKNDVWLQLTADGKVIYENILSRGSSEEWQADKRFDLWTGKAEYLDLILNGNPLGSPGEGVIKDITVTRSGMEVKQP